VFLFSQTVAVYKNQILAASSSLIVNIYENVFPSV